MRKDQENTTKKSLQRTRFCELRMLHRFSLDIHDTLVYMRLPLQGMFHVDRLPFNAIAISEWFRSDNRYILVSDDIVVTYVGPYDG